MLVRDCPIVGVGTLLLEKAMRDDTSLLPLGGGCAVVGDEQTKGVSCWFAGPCLMGRCSWDLDDSCWGDGQWHANGFWLAGAVEGGGRSGFLATGRMLPGFNDLRRICLLLDLAAQIFYRIAKGDATDRTTSTTIGSEGELLSMEMKKMEQVCHGFDGEKDIDDDHRRWIRIPLIVAMLLGGSGLSIGISPEWVIGGNHGVDDGAPYLGSPVVYGI
ncbi:hypothetical protein ACLOJK_034966 [Asimina triloba]